MLNFSVMAVRDTELRTRLLKKKKCTFLFSFASLSRIENISIVSRRDKKHNKLWREPPAVIKNNKARGKAEKAKYQY